MSSGIYVKGMVIEDYVGYHECMRFDLAAQEVVLVMSRENVERYPIGGRYEFRFMAVYNTIFLLMRYGGEDGNWMSAPYSPHLSDGFEAEAFAEGEGLALTVLQVCNEDGRVCGMDILSLTSDFSNLLHGAADILYHEVPFDRDEHRAVIAAVYDEFATDEELAEQCDEDFRCAVA